MIATKCHRWPSINVNTTIRPFQFEWRFDEFTKEKMTTQLNCLHFAVSFAIPHSDSIGQIDANSKQQ